MKSFKFKHALILLTIAFAGLVCFGVIPVSAIAALFASGKGLSLATAAAAQTVQTTATTTTANRAAPDLLRPAIDKKITEMRPSAYPLDTILRSIGNDEKIGSLEAKWYSVDIRGVQDALTSAHTNTVTNGAFTNTAGPANLSVGSDFIWSIDDLVYVPGSSVPAITNGQFTGEEIMLQVIDKPSSNTIRVICLNSNATYDVPSIANAAVIIESPCLP